MTDKELIRWSGLNSRIEALEWAVAWMLSRDQRMAFMVDCVDAIIQDCVEGAGWTLEDVERFRKKFDGLKDLIGYFDATPGC